jgi:hypothetical protein
VTDRVRLARQKAGRWAAGPLLVRGLLLAAGVTTLALATPGPLLLGKGAPAVLAVALLVAVAPRGRLVSVLLLTAATSWLISTIAFHEHIAAARLVGLAAAMYLVHSLAALAAVLPYDAVLPPGVLAGWLLRAATVAGCCAAIGLGALVEAPGTGGPGYLLGSIVGVAVVGVLVWVLARTARR